ncbi:MAG: HAD family phosphatase [Spirochaetaceae bacterium]
MFKGVIFDFDGTLVDTLWAYALTDIEFAKALGGVYEDIDHNEFVGGGVRYFVESMMSRLNITDRSVDELIALNNKIFLDIADDNVEIYPKMLSLIKDLHKKGIPMAVASGSSQWIIETIAERTGLLKYINKLYSSELVEYDKPQPDIYIHAASELGLKPEECLVFEDTSTGFRSAVRAGMKCIWFDSIGNKSKELQSKAYDYYPDGQKSFKPSTILELL